MLKLNECTAAIQIKKNFWNWCGSVEIGKNKKYEPHLGKWADIKKGHKIFY